MRVFVVRKSDVKKTVRHGAEWSCSREIERVRLEVFLLFREPVELLSGSLQEEKD